MCISPFGAVSLVPKIAHYHNKEPNFLLEWVRFGAKSKLTRKGVYYVYISFRGSELGAEDSRLSQEITLRTTTHRHDNLVPYA